MIGKSLQAPSLIGTVQFTTIQKSNSDTNIKTNIVPEYSQLEGEEENNIQ